MERSRTIKKWAAEYILDHLDDYEGQTIYGADLAGRLTEEPNASGTYIVGKNAALAFIGDHIADCADEYDYEIVSFGEVLPNPFANPEAFIVCMLINVVSDLLSDVTIVSNRWCEEIELTREIIEEIKKELGVYFDDEDEIKN